METPQIHSCENNVFVVAINMLLLGFPSVFYFKFPLDFVLRIIS